MASNNNNTPKPPPPPEIRIECGYCHRVMPESEFRKHHCALQTILPMVAGSMVALFLVSLALLFFYGQIVL